MNKISPSGTSFLRAGLLGALAVFVLSACSTALKTPPEPVDPNAVDVGYGTTDKDHITGSVARIEPDDLPRQNYRTIGEMIQDQVPGVIVVQEGNGNFHVRIRGSTSFLASEEPLFVLDGMTLQSSSALIGVSPSVVETITVLKDAGSTAIYGSRGANGVILIKTKKGGGGGG
jgi:TonB-dependent SusC/RagA subfamily outer membrane receptor